MQVYILDDATQPLLVDTDADGICDSINPGFLPNNPQGNPPAVVIDLTPVAPTGASFFPMGISFPPAYQSQCFGGSNGDGTGSDDAPPDELCATTFLTRVIPDNTDPDFARNNIFGRAPLSGLRCVGDRFDFLGAGINPGSACVAARVTDNGGNESISSPLRVCLDDALGGADCPAPIGGTFTPDFSCTDGCSTSPPPGALQIDYAPFERIGPKL